MMKRRVPDDIAMKILNLIRKRNTSFIVAISYMHFNNDYRYPYKCVINHFMDTYMGLPVCFVLCTISNMKLDFADSMCNQILNECRYPGLCYSGYYKKIVSFPKNQPSLCRYRCIRMRRFMLSSLYGANPNIPKYFKVEGK